MIHATSDQPFTGGYPAITPNEDLPDRREERQTPPANDDPPSTRVIKAALREFLQFEPLNACYVKDIFTTEHGATDVLVSLWIRPRFRCKPGDELRDLASELRFLANLLEQRT